MADPNNDPGSLYGYDVDVDTDIKPDGRACSGPRLVQNAILHRLMEDTLPLIGAPDDVVPFGEDVRKWVGEVTTQAAATAKGPRLVGVLNRDARLDPAQTRVSVAVQPSGALVDLVITISGALTDGTPLSIVVGVTKWSVQLLSQGT